MKREWRFLDTGFRSAAENMALDSVILRCKSEGLIPDTVRLLRFKPPAVLVGYHQDVEQEVRLDYVNKRGIDINRRITGGGAIYFDESSVGWEIIASRSSIPARGRVESLFEAMCEGAIKALKILGVEASFRPKNDVEVEGRKISGTGGTELEGAILFQGTLLVDFDVETMVKALRIPIVKLKDKELSSVRERVTWLKRELGYTPSYEEVKGALKEGFEEALDVKLKEAGLTAHEEERLREELPWFSSPDWVFLDRRISKGYLLHSSAKKPGGFIKVSLSLDKEANLIKNIFITGDFFVFPRRAIYDLESRLKFAPCDEQEIKKII
ncbi:TPA: lipoate--protein ligase, partial [Candidatus Bathyarchaeota archaeon]|nr:lipoate--protein ligase [Candidatus Bathyarchaeota archaeon]